MLQFRIAIPPVPHGLRAFDCIPIWALNDDHFIALHYTSLIEKLRNANAKEDNLNRGTVTLLSLPDIHWIKSHIESEHHDQLHAFVFSYFYGMLHGSILHYAGAGMIKMPMAYGQRVSDGGYLYLRYDPAAKLCPSIFGMYGPLVCGRHVDGAWLPSCTHIAQSVLDLPQLEHIALMGRVGVVSYAEQVAGENDDEKRSNAMNAMCDLRQNDRTANGISIFEMSPEHPIVKNI
jgi:hypothetical protein